MTQEEFYIKAVEYWKHFYCLEPNDYGSNGLTRQVTDEWYNAGESYEEQIDDHASRYDLEKIQGWLRP